MLRAIPILALLLAAAPALALAQDCPPQTLDESALDSLHEELRDAGDIQTAQSLMDELWMIWSEAPDAQAKELLDSGKERIALYDFENAVRAFDALVEYCPEFAEAYNQRAFAHFLKQEPEAALADLERTLEIIPRHIGALAGKGLSLLALGRKREALAVLQDAVALNPYLKERALVPALKQELGVKEL